MESSNEFELATSLEKLINILNKGKTLIDGKITSVDEDNFTCEIQVLTTTFSGVPLRVLIGSQASVYEIPVIGTSCLISFRDSDIQRPQIMSIDQVDTLKINCVSLVEFNGGSLGGLVKVEDLVTRLNDIEDLVNDLIEQYNGHTHILALSSGTGTAAETVSQETGTLTPTTRGDIENTKITQ